MVAHKDVVVALLGASAGLAGLTLVFLGLVVSALATFDAGTPSTILWRYRRPALAAVVAFIVSLGCVTTSALWLARLCDSHSLYVGAVVTFFGQIVLLLIASLLSVPRLLRD
jgi:hypothetical protein